MKEEKRKHNRFKINQMCEIFMGREIYIPVKGIDMSEGGFSFRTEELIAINSIVKFQIAVYKGDKSHTADCEGVVRRIDFDKEDYKGAIEFANLTTESKKIIHDYVKEK